MTEFTERCKTLITPYVAQYGDKARTIGRIAKAWTKFESNGSEEELKTRLQQIAAKWEFGRI